MRILVVEDEHRIAEALKKGLMQEGYAVDVTHDGDTGYDYAVNEAYDCLILDLMLPGKDGLSICTQLRSQKIHTPILMLTAKNTISDRVKGLNSGADDYLAKPFAFEELLARVRALLRRPNELLSNIVGYGDVELDTNQKIVKKAGIQVPLSSKEYSLLEYIVRQNGRVVSKEEVISHVWDYDADILPNTVEAHVKRLRAKLGSKSITTVRGFGYKIG
ncbi:response regulator transcription factor [Candidatus Woesebacteria bacterium]|nr:response regulator transcription factor [Candidatus Woesebacteria bacterium]